mgnify:FL=1
MMAKLNMYISLSWYAIEFITFKISYAINDFDSSTAYNIQADMMYIVIDSEGFEDRIYIKNPEP